MSHLSGLPASSWREKNWEFKDRQNGERDSMGNKETKPAGKVVMPSCKIGSVVMEVVSVGEAKRWAGRVFKTEFLNSRFVHRFVHTPWAG